MVRHTSRASAIGAMNVEIHVPSAMPLVTAASRLGILQVETRSQFFADRWRVNQSSTLVRDNSDLSPFPTLAGHRFSRWKLYSVAVGEFDVPPNEWSVTFKYIFRANRKAYWQARGIAHV
jgi:hypothetical protein